MCQKANCNNSRTAYMLTIAIQFSIVLIFLTLTNYSVDSFNNRIMGNGLLAGIDISSRTNTFFMILFIIIPIVTIIFIKILEKILENTEEDILKFMSLISILGIINTFFSFIGFLNSTSRTVLNTSALLLFGINIILILLNLIYSKIIKKDLQIDNIKWSFLASIPFAFLGSLILHKFNIQIINNKLNWIIIYFICVLSLFIFINFKNINKGALKKTYILFMLAPLLEFIFLEVYNILNQYNIILQHKIRIILIIYFICFIAFIIYYFINYKKDIKTKYIKYYYPIILITFALIIAAPNMVTVVNTDFFESANHGMGVYEFFKYGKIPLLETFDAHMFNNQFFGIIYGILNNDIMGAIFCTYISYNKVIYYIILYLFLNKLFSKDKAFLMTLFYPFIMDKGIGFSYTDTVTNMEFMAYIGFIAILTLINAHNNKTIKSYLLFWSSLVFLCIWKLDIGFSISVASVITLIYLLFKEKNKLEIKHTIISFCSVIGIFILVVLSMCFIKNINPITRAIEFISIAMSNINWGYASLGNTHQLSYVVCYYVVPLLIISLLIYILYKLKGKECISETNIILLVLGLFFIFNLQRGMVRHSLAENTTAVILSTALIFISIFLYEYCISKKDILFPIIYVIIIVLSGMLMTTDFKTYNNNFEEMINKYVKFSIHDEAYTEKVERVQISPVMQNEYRDLKMVLENLLEDNETYMDLSNQTLLYALLGREKPVYINQSPALLSGELTQELFINEIENSDKDVVLAIQAKEKELSHSLDGILNDYRYYLVTEYTYQSYIPLASVNGYEILVRKDKYNEKLSMIEHIKNGVYELINNQKYTEKYSNTFELGMIPYIWGQYDELKDNNKVFLDLLDGTENEMLDKNIKLDIDSINKNKGNYLKLSINSKGNTKLSIKLKNNGLVVGEYNLDIKEGLNNYVIRISTTYAWYQNNISDLTLYSEKAINLEEVSILEGNKLRNIIN